MVQILPIDEVKDALAEKLREELDVHSAYLGVHSFWNEGIDAHFKGHTYYNGTTNIRVSDYWSREGITAPADIYEIEIISRRSFSSGWAAS